MKEEIDLDVVVREAREGIEALHDEKAWANETVIYALIEAGAQVVQNHRQITGTYVVEVIFDGIHFIHTSADQLISTAHQQVD